MPLNKRYTGRLSNFGPPVLAQFQYSQCLHVAVEQRGKQPVSGRQRWQCVVCHWAYTEGVDTKLQKIRLIAPYYKRKKSTAEAATMLGFSEETVRKYYRKFDTFLGTHTRRPYRMRARQ